jgi:hypothetical protein
VRAGTAASPAEVYVPVGAVRATTTISYTELPTPTLALSATADYAGRAFRLDAYQNGELLPGYVFSQPVCLTLAYDATTLTEVYTRPVRLYYLDDTGWQQGTVGNCQATALEAEQPVISAEVNRAGEYALGQGEPVRRVFLPILRR